MSQTFWGFSFYFVATQAFFCVILGKMPLNLSQNNELFFDVFLSISVKFCIFAAASYNIIGGKCVL